MDVEREGAPPPSLITSQTPHVTVQPTPPGSLASSPDRDLIAPARNSTTNSELESTVVVDPASLFTSLTFPPKTTPPASHRARIRRRRSESSVPALERDELPPSAVAPDKRTFSLDDLAVFRAGSSQISTNSPVYSSFEHPTPTLEPSSSFDRLPPSVAESLLPPSRASSLEEINFDISESRDPPSLVPDVNAFANPLTAASTPRSLTPAYSHAVPPNSTEFGHPPGSPPPFTLPSSAASPQHYIISDSDRDGNPSSFFTPESSGSFFSSGSTSFYTPGNVAPVVPVSSQSGSSSTEPVARDAGRRNSFASEKKGRNSASVNPLGSSSSGTTQESRISLSPSSSAHPRSCDVYIGVFGRDPLLIRYAKWMHAELESHGVACFSADRSLYADQRSHDIARAIIHSATFGVVLIARKSFKNPYTIEELTIFLDRKNLVPVFFDVAPPDCLVRDIVERQGEIWEMDGGELWKVYLGEEKGWSDAVKGLLTVEDWRVEAYKRNWRESIQRVVSLVGSKLGRKSVADKEKGKAQELPWPRNVYFAGREKELKLLEKVLFSEPPAPPPVASRRSDASSKAETDDVESRTSNYDSENQEEINLTAAWNAQTGSGLGKVVGLRGRSSQRDKRRDSADRKRESDKSKYAHSCIVTGIPGIGKSELALEYAYRHSQKYKMVLWVGGEARYLRQNYLNLSTLLGLNVGTETQQAGGRPRTFEEQESEAVQRIRYELQKDVPYLLIIDNLDTERDSMDGRELSELLPRAGSATHVVITTRLPRVMHLDSIELPYLSSFEALTLMRDGKRSERSFSVQQIDKFKEFEDKLRRLPFGLAIVGRLINEFNMKPSEILAKMGTIDTKRNSAIERDDVVLRSNPFLVKLLDVCFNLMGGVSGAKSLAVRMAYVGGWFGPTACPLSLLTMAAQKLQKEMGGLQIRTMFGAAMMMRCCMSRAKANTESDARDVLTRLGLARASTRQDCLYFPDIIQVYCQKRGGVIAARAFVRVIRKNGSIVNHYEHFWAAAYLVCRYGSDPAVVEFQVPDLLDFTRRLVLPLAIRAFNTFSRCTAALEVLRLCYVMLEEVEKSYVSQIQDRWDRSLCWRRNDSVPHQVDEYVWQDLTLLKALLLEARAKLLMRGGQYEAGEELCRTCISIRTVMLGADHADTLAAQETLSKFVRKRNSSSS
ncbi:hypothetical protein KC19_6G018300 [Ceratodon purpureus]|uniref:Plant disease resistance WDH domain-containing protein n=1 Tax=Ceratodon purpureus TaxID=3225 RepID=A0A8T0HE54_CERPU|nr:hypothetical protein KC19_6G018300 [Ceratodon purpureus]